MTLTARVIITTQVLCLLKNQPNKELCPRSIGLSQLLLFIEARLIHNLPISLKDKGNLINLSLRCSLNLNYLLVNKFQTEISLESPPESASNQM